MSVTIYDTTLRDGTQGSGVSFSSLDKLRVAHKLDEFGVDYIEGGWPGSNPKDVTFFEEAAKHTWLKAKIAAFGSTRRAGIAVEDDPQVALLLAAQTPVVTIFGKSWKLHVTEVLRTTPEENQAMIRDTVKHLADHGREVVYDAEHFFDGFKDDEEHALATLRAAAEGGADILVLCDTNGGTLPEEVHAVCARVCEDLEMPVGIHTHDDSGLGVANALAGIRAGAVQVQGTINGYGERTGNCNLTSVIPNLQLKMELPVVEDLTALTALSHFVADLANCARNERAPFVGSTAFSHKGGMHVNAVQKLARTYEHIEPVSVGNSQHILISELSGQSNVLLKAQELGVDLEKGSAEVMEIVRRLKELEEKGFEFEAAEASFELLVREAVGSYRPFFDFKEFHCSYRRRGDGEYVTCEATVKLNVGGEDNYTVAEGDGPVNALDAALRKALKPFYPAISEAELTDYKVRIIDSHMGTASKTRVLILSSDGATSWGTVGVSYNIIEASWLALVDSFDYFLFSRGLEPIVA
ncbi:MAG: citramalate synthase [Verrucomicrobiales bacterium]